MKATFIIAIFVLRSAQFIQLTCWLEELFGYRVFGENNIELGWFIHQRHASFQLSHWWSIKCAHDRCKKDLFGISFDFSEITLKFCFNRRNMMSFVWILLCCEKNFSLECQLPLDSLRRHRISLDIFEQWDLWILAFDFDKLWSFYWILMVTSW